MTTMRSILALACLTAILCAAFYAPPAVADEDNPEWLHSKEGLCGGLPPQWEPVTTDGNSIRPWGRQYLFDGLPAPASVTALGESIILRPMALVAKVKGQEVAWSGKRTETVKINDGTAEVTTEASANGLQLKGRIRVEFDGMIRADWQIAAAEEITLDALSLEIPYRSPMVKYLYTYPGSWGSARNAGSAPREPLNLKFMPYLWLGDEKCGLCWFSESDRNFSNDDPEKVIQIIPGEAETLLRVNLISKPKTVGKDRPLEYSFGFQATPVRDNPQDVWDYRICHHGSYGIEDKKQDTQTSTLDRLAELGVRTVCFHEHWTDIQNYTSTTHGEELKRLVKSCHERNIRLLLYFGYLMSDLAPEWAKYSEECLAAPRGGEYDRKPEQHCFIVCYRSVWQDFMAHGIAKMMDDYDIDGVYLDGTANPWPCANTKHGCGYTKEDGTTAPCYPIFSTREMMKRIWTLVKTRKPDGLVNVHQSTCMTIPTLAFATSYWDGEQFGGIQRGPWSLDVLPLDAFRCEFMGRQWGVPSEMLCYGQPYSYSEATSFALLHDVLVRGSLGGGLEMESKLWNAFEKFGRHQAQWIPYWDNQKYVQTDGNDTKVSLYTRQDKGTIAVISNLGKERRTVQATLKLDALGLPGAVETKDVINECTVPISAEGVLSFDLNALDFRAVLITSEK
jgi:hypothetical protein